MIGLAEIIKLKIIINYINYIIAWQISWANQIENHEIIIKNYNYINYKTAMID